jgi:RNA polymerase sigma-70 factor, ECF subfamily
MSKKSQPGVENVLVNWSGWWRARAQKRIPARTSVQTPECRRFIWHAGSLQRFRAGDRPALAEIYSTYVESVRRVATAVLRRSGWGRLRSTTALAAEVCDVVQEVFARAFAPLARRRFDGQRDYGAYLRSAAWNLAIDQQRAHRRQQMAMGRQRDAAIVPSALVSGASGAMAGDEALEEKVAVVVSYVTSLPSALRRAHDALYVRGLSQRDAATALGVGRQTIRSLDSQIRNGLCNALARAGHIEPRAISLHSRRLAVAHANPSGTARRIPD